MNAKLPAAVAGGNVETSQRITDVLLKALAQMLPDRIPAASSGTMNNLTIGGIDPRTGQTYAYYETIAGGSGARPTGDGVSGVHTHMTNSLNTPVEALEYAYPFRVRRYSYRRASGGHGKYHGGDGIIREIELLAPAQVTLLTDRRIFAPYGLEGGGKKAQRPNSPHETNFPASATSKPAGTYSASKHQAGAAGANLKLWPPEHPAMLECRTHQFSLVVSRVQLVHQTRRLCPGGSVIGDCRSRHRHRRRVQPARVLIVLTQQKTSPTVAVIQ